MNRILLREQIARFLAEDAPSGDITTEAIFADADTEGTAILVAKEEMRCCGIASVVGEVFRVQNPAIRIDRPVEDGSLVGPEEILLWATGPVADLLTAERVALNLAMHLCGIATLTAKFVAKALPRGAMIVDTRKTTPGLRMLEKYAVRVGGGANHRHGLSDGVLIKDNHIAACGSITAAVERVRRRAPHTLRIEVEVTNLAEVEECLEIGVDIIMLDNMEPDTMRRAVDLVAGRAIVEASGGVTLDNVEEVAATGVDYISVGALTHSAPAVDIAMRIIDTEEPG